MKIKRTPVIVAMLIGLLSVIFSLATPKVAASIAKVTVQLPWVHTIEYSGFYLAQEQGHFRKQNLDVDLVPFNFKKPTDPITQVSTGKADFGITGISAILLARSQGKPLVGVATIYQRNPSVLVALAKSNIKQPTDLIGKKIMIDLNGLDGAIYKAMIMKAGIPLEQVTIVPRDDYTNAPLLNGKVDAMDAYVNNQPVQLEKQGEKITVLSPEDYGINTYSNVIFTTQTMIVNQPQLVEKFIQATVLGIADAVKDPQRATTLALRLDKDLDPQSEAESMRRAIPLFVPAGKQPGLMQSQPWQLTQQVLVEQKILKQPIDVQDAFNLTFLEKIYGVKLG